ncbi:DUF2889 domain-containing protein [Noviherbaspirillum sp. Root189]|uniref:DUF2889 domain-containing protein n=1 Tax=Noviherbaspirillum sp. Root189 TaxID=1736487 RepID=UPI00070EAC5B|nr:DUF2889 domain-containing protein [Noviherbaspirillum sp. Root189]KRB75154.1 hypothetical protein ASE07_26555 [Noviherbaspirillum sp. Root189]
MPLPDPEHNREPIHTRTISLRAYRRADGLFDVEGRLQDVRAREITLPHGPLPAGEPIHDMQLRLTVDASATIVAVAAVTDAAPYGRSCAVITPDYEKLVGLRVGPGFRSGVRRLLAGVNGCTHLTELLLTMGTGVIQALTGEVPQPEGIKPFSLDGCHALDTRGPIVAQFHPRWYRPQPDADSEDGSQPKYNEGT